MIKIENIHLKYSELFSLFINKLFIPEGNILAIIGPNGAGKTTLLNIIASFEKPKSGSIEIFGNDILNMKDKISLRRQMSFVFSEPYLLKGTVFYNISLPLKLRGINDNGRVNNMLELFKINHLRDNNPSTLSQGEKHRVALSRAFITEPKLVLLDEPFSSLDERYKKLLINELRCLIKLNKITAIFVTQNHDEALAFADTVAVMKNGRILQVGTPQDIFSKPDSKDVADFVGLETILEGLIIKKEDNLCFIKVKDKIIEAVSMYNEGDNVFVCIRPEEVIISKEILKDSVRNHFKAEIINIEPWGLEYKLILDCDFKLVAAVTKQSIENMNLKIKQEIFASFKATAIHLIRR